MPISSTLLKQKLTAFAIHLAFSLLIISGIAGLLAFLWYPDFLFSIGGGLEGLKIVALVDIVIGPILTFVVYKKGKKGLLLDYSLIVTGQVLCLAYGIHLTYEERPLLLVLVDESFVVINKKSMELNKIPTSALQKIPGPYPKFAYAPVPPESKQISMQQMIAEFLRKGYYHTRYEAYHPLRTPEGIAYMKQHGATDWRELLNPRGRKAHETTQKKTETENVRYFTITGKYSVIIAKVRFTSATDFRIEKFEVPSAPQSANQ